MGEDVGGEDGVVEEVEDAVMVVDGVAEEEEEEVMEGVETGVDDMERD